MCEFCEMLKKDIYCENKPIISHIKQSIDSIGTIVCGIYGNLLKVSCIVQIPTGICTPILGEAEINYCPMCGRELSEVSEMTNKDIDHAKETIDRLTEELKHSKDYITQLKHDLDKTYNQLMEVEKDAQEHIAELKSELEVKNNLLKIKNGLCGSFDCLPSEPISAANMLINAKEEYVSTSLEKALCNEIKPLVDKYSIDDLEQIAEHLMVYCRHHREDYE